MIIAQCSYEWIVSQYKEVQVLHKCKTGAAAALLSDKPGGKDIIVVPLFTNSIRSCDEGLVKPESLLTCSSLTALGGICRSLKVQMGKS